jgi:hypothetical protein
VLDAASGALERPASVSDPLPRPRPPAWRASTSPAVLDEIGDEAVSLVAWERELPEELPGVLTAWARRPREHCGVVPARGGDLAPALTGLSGSVREWLAADAAALLARFGDLTASARLRLWLGAIRTDQCRKFHVDWLRYRMITTYAGPGTDWLPEESVDRGALAHAADCGCDEERPILRPGHAPRRAAAGDVLILRGARPQAGRAAVHRSPPIEGSGVVRVVLIASTIDAE